MQSECQQSSHSFDGLVSGNVMKSETECEARLRVRRKRSRKLDIYLIISRDIKWTFSHHALSRLWASLFETGEDGGVLQERRTCRGVSSITTCSTVQRVLIPHHAFGTDDDVLEDAALPHPRSLAARLFCLATPRRTQRPHLQPPPHHLHRHTHPTCIASPRTARQPPLLSPRIHRRPQRPHTRAAVQACPRTT